ncbi:MAG: arabinan endo-1,5-alpha-L-arabinosidase [Polyangiaceae bacterium]
MPFAVPSSFHKSLLLVGVCLGVATACRATGDVVASSKGDYDPAHPPAQFALSGDLEIHDPVLLDEGDGFRVLGSGEGLVSRTSPDGLTWSEGEPIFSSKPEWITELLPDTTSLWSPSIASFGGHQHLYYAASTFGQDRSCIGHAARSLSSVGAFEDRGRLLCSNLQTDTDEFNAIDPSPFVDDTGAAYLVFGSYLSGIKLVELDENGALRSNDIASIAARPPPETAEQAPSLMKWSGTYYLFLSFDACCLGSASTHRIMVGRSKDIRGPYKDRDGNLLLEGGGTELLASGERYKGPGSSEIYTNEKTRWLVYHAYDAERDGLPVLRIAEFAFDEAGWPVTTGP